MKQIVILLMIGLPCILQAQGFQVSLQGQKQQAMAGAGTGLVTDGAALFYNPGGVSFLKENSVSIGATPVISRLQYTDGPSSVSYESKSPISYPFTGYAVLGNKNSKVKFGFAAYTPFGSTIDWQDGWTGRFVITHLQLYALYLQPTVSIRISDKLGIGAGFVFSTGKVEVQRDLPYADNNGKYGNAFLTGNGYGSGFNTGIYYKPSSCLSFGLTYHSQIDFRVKNGTAIFTLPSSISSMFPPNNFGTHVLLPSITTFGVGIAASKKLSFAFDASLIGWKAFDTLTFDYADNTNFRDVKSARGYEDAFAYRLGMQYAASKKIDLRGGVKYLVTPVQDGYVGTDVPDATHFNYSIGLGYKISKRFTADASFTLQQMERSDINIESQLNGTYKTNLYMPGLSLNYNF